ncbi:MAG: hypothetical protein QM704_01430 [Anaeromyxobacteraceae bacterium]
MRSISLGRSRTLVLAAVTFPLDDSVRPPFASLLPAYGPSERQQGEADARELIRLGCAEFCCVGPEAELLHDALDEIVEREGALEVVTTWIQEPAEASAYFVHAAGGGRLDLLAAIDAHPELRERVEGEALR